MTPDALLTIAQAAARIGISRKTLRRWIRKGAVCGLKRVGPYRTLRLPESAVRALIQERERASGHLGTSGDIWGHPEHK